MYMHGKKNSPLPFSWLFIYVFFIQSKEQAAAYIGSGSGAMDVKKTQVYNRLFCDRAHHI